MRLNIAPARRYRNIGRIDTTALYCVLVGTEQDMMHYRHHVFFCTNRREDGSACCANHDALALRDYAKARIKSLGLAGAGRVRINVAGCLDRCEEGPIIVVYPEGVWYTYVDKQDIDEIVQQHLVGGRIVDRLRI